MAHILVGEEDTFKEIALIFDKQSISTLKIEWWRSLALRMDIPPDFVKKLEKDVLIDKITYSVIILELLTQWRSLKSDSATLGAFHALIPDDKKQLKDYVQDLIWNKAKTWNDLDDSLQKLVLQSKVQLLGQTYTLNSLGVLPEKTMLRENLPQKPFDDVIFKCDEFEFPIKLPFYINRKLTIRQNLNPKIFENNCDDIFVFEGIERHQLSMIKKARLAGQQELTDESSNQIKKSKLSVRFIRLKFENHFSEIVKKTSYPVHRIKYNKIDKTFYWVCTIGSINLITEFLSDSCKEICEDDFITDTLSVFNSRPVAICSSPGMGKSFLLKHLASQMQHKFPNRFVIFLGLQTLMDCFKINMKPKEKISMKLIIDVLAQESTSTVLGYFIMTQLMHNQTTQFEIILDGFDEIPSGLRGLAKEFLKLFLQTQNIRCHITSRPHMTTELEQTVGVISYNIAPFTTEDQINFFCDYWIEKLDIKKPNLLPTFASRLIKTPSLQNKRGNLYGDIAGIPLQCDMLAQVYSTDASNFCEDPNSNDKICTDTLFTLYTRFMEYKFRNIDEDKKVLVKKFHWCKALEHLFPECLEARIIWEPIKFQLEKTTLSNETIFGVGILEARKDLNHRKRKETMEFLHRTFAEFLLAEFICTEISRQQADLNDIWTTFIYDTVLEKQKVTPGFFESRDFLDNCEKIIMLSLSWEEGLLSVVDFNTLREKMYECLSESPENEDKLYRLVPSNKISRWGFTEFYDEYQNGVNTNQLRFMVKHFSSFLGVLHNLEWFGLEDELRRASEYRLQQCSFLHSTVCFFLDTLLMEIDAQNVISTQQIVQFPVHRGYFSGLDSFSKTFTLKLLTCVTSGFGNLARLVLNLCNDKLYNNIISMLQIDYESCREILILAANHNDGEFFKKCCELVKLLASVEIWDAKLNRIKKQSFDMVYVQTPLHVAVSKGNYNVAEYLVTLDKIDRSAMDGLWQVCLFKSCQDSEYVLQQKDEILCLLKSNDLILDFDAKSDVKFPNEVHSKLFISICDLVGYLPCTEDAAAIAFHAIHYWDNSGSQMDSFVDWTRAKKVENIFTVKSGFQSSLLHFALTFEKVKPETFCKILKCLPFNPNNMLRDTTRGNRGEAMTTIIVELTGLVNHVDNADCNRSLLHFAVYHENTNVVQFLLVEGASVHLKDSDGNTSLHLAVLEDRPVPEIVKLLIMYSSDIHEKNNIGETPLSLVLKKTGESEFDYILQLFKEKFVYNFKIILALILACVCSVKK